MQTLLRTFPCLLFLAAGSHLLADHNPLDCSRRSLADRLERAREGETISFTGICLEPITIRTDGLTVKGIGSAVIDGQGKQVVTIDGALRITLENIEIRNGTNGIVVQNGGHASLSDVTAHDNALSGLSLQTKSSVVLEAVTVRNNLLHGLDMQTGSAATVTGVFAATNNRVFGMNVNGSSLTLSRATVTASGNALGIQIATGANVFLNDSSSVINASSNLSTGLTVVSGAQLVSFGGTINALDNRANGVSVNSKAGLDLDAGSAINASGNMGNGVVLQQQSVMTVFNNPMVSGVPGFSMIRSTGNGGNGVGVLTSSTLTLVNQARIVSTGNRVGLFADNGSAATIRNTELTGNTAFDLQMTFGVRADLQSLTLGTWSCDATVIVRGANAVACPH